MLGGQQQQQSAPQIYLPRPSSASSSSSAIIHHQHHRQQQLTPTQQQQQQRATSTQQKSGPVPAAPRYSQLTHGGVPSLLTNEELDMLDKVDPDKPDNHAKFNASVMVRARFIHSSLTPPHHSQLVVISFHSP